MGGSVATNSELSVADRTAGTMKETHIKAGKSIGAQNRPMQHRETTSFKLTLTQCADPGETFNEIVLWRGTTARRHHEERKSTKIGMDQFGEEPWRKLEALSV